MDMMNLAFRLGNGLITLYFAPLLFKIYRKTNRRFYLYWSLGYVFYGINILTRLFVPTAYEPTTLGVVAYIFLLTGFIFMVVGIGELINRVRLILFSALIMPILLGLIILVESNYVPMVIAVGLAPYLFIVASLFLIQTRCKVDVSLLIVGWANILLFNVGYVLGWMDQGFLDLLSAVSKVIIFWGMVQPGFYFLEDDLKRFLISGVAKEYFEDFQGGFSLITTQNASREREIQWIDERVEYNARKGVRTILISMYDLITASDMRNQTSEKELYIVRMLPGNRSLPYPFEDYVMSINDDVNQLDILFSDIVNYSNERNIPIEIILYSISHLIHSHGWKRIYTFLTSKMPILKSSQVYLTGFFFPNTHDDPSDVAKFEKMADNVITQ